MSCAQLFRQWATLPASTGYGAGDVPGFTWGFSVACLGIGASCLGLRSLKEGFFGSNSSDCTAWLALAAVLSRGGTKNNANLWGPVERDDCVSYCSVSLLPSSYQHPFSWKLCPRSQVRTGHPFYPHSSHQPGISVYG